MLEHDDVLATLRRGGEPYETERTLLSVWSPQQQAALAKLLRTALLALDDSPARSSLIV